MRAFFIKYTATAVRSSTLRDIFKEPISNVQLRIFFWGNFQRYGRITENLGSNVYIDKMTTWFQIKQKNTVCPSINGFLKVCKPNVPLWIIGDFTLSPAISQALYLSPFAGTGIRVLKPVTGASR